MKTRKEIKDKKPIIDKLDDYSFITDATSQIPRYPEGSTVPVDHVRALIPMDTVKVFGTNKKDTYVIRREKPKPGTHMKQAALPPPPTPQQIANAQFWEQKELILTVFPEVKDVWETAEAKIKKKGCKSCTKNAQKNLVVRKMELAYRENKRDIEPLRLILGSHFLNKLRNFGNTAESIKRLIRGPRTTCLDCTRKHIAQAIVLLGEAQMGYPQHRWLAVGHLAEATEECLGDHPELAAELRNERLGVMDDAEYKANLMGFFDEIDKLEEAENTPENGQK